MSSAATVTHTSREHSLAPRVPSPGAAWDRHLLTDQSGVRRGKIPSCAATGGRQRNRRLGTARDRSRPTHGNQLDEDAHAQEIEAVVRDRSRGRRGRRHGSARQISVGKLREAERTPGKCSWRHNLCPVVVWTNARWSNIKLHVAKFSRNETSISLCRCSALYSGIISSCSPASLLIRQESENGLIAFSLIW